MAALDELIPRFGIMRERLDVEKLLIQPDGKVEANVIREAHQALHTPQFLELSMMIRTTGHILQKMRIDWKAASATHQSGFLVAGTRKR